MMGSSPWLKSWGGGELARIIRNRKFIIHDGIFNQIISLPNLFIAWRAYRKGKRNKPDVQEFESALEDNVFALHHDLEYGSYRPGGYQQFRITDPKSRTISKASVRDRLLHQAIYQALYAEFDKTFIFDSYSCRDKKGTHKAFERLVTISRKISRNYTQPCWVIKMDIKKFFDSVDHEILFKLLSERIADLRLLGLLKQIIESFSFSPGKGMPLGNLTSQLFANVYLDPLDKFVKHQMYIGHYIRYADDFVIFSTDPDYLIGCLVELNIFLKDKLELQVHPNKITLRKLSQGIDFVGYIALPYYSLPRRKTVNRILRKLKNSKRDELAKALPSYLGHISHSNSHQLIQKIKEIAPR